MVPGSSPGGSTRSKHAAWRLPMVKRFFCHFFKDLHYIVSGVYGYIFNLINRRLWVQVLMMQQNNFNQVCVEIHTIWNLWDWMKSQSLKKWRDNTRFLYNEWESHGWNCLMVFSSSLVRTSGFHPGNMSSNLVETAYVVWQKSNHNVLPKSSKKRK